jgi:hypothetical protein
MADHTDFIRIRGLESSAEEVFQGLGGASLSVSEAGGDEDTEWTAIPEDVVALISTYTDEVKTWLATVEDYEPPEDGSRGVSGLPAIPSLPAIIAGAGAIVATGGAALPAVATLMVTQVIMNLAGSQLEDIRHNFDPNSPINVFKKAFLKNGKSILSEAWLQSGSEPSILQARLTELIEKTGNLEQPLKDLALIDAIIQFGDDMKARIKGKALEF